jgi:hypothetical protein
MANNAAYAQVTARPSDRCAGRGRRPERTSTAARYWQSPFDLFQVQPSSDNLIVSDLQRRHPAHLKRLPVAAGARQRHSVQVVSPSWTDEDTIGLIRRLAVHYPDAGIAGILNRQGRRVCDRFVGPDASLLVAGFCWLYGLQPDPEHAGQRPASELSRSGAGHLMHDAQPDRRDLSSAIAKMILVTYKFDVHPGRGTGAPALRGRPGQGPGGSCRGSGPSLVAAGRRA